LGLTSDDDDYIDPYEDQNDLKNSADSVSEEPEAAKAASSSSSNKLDLKKFRKEKKSKKSLKETEEVAPLSPIEQLPTDMSDTTDSESGKMDYVNDAECTSMHEGRQLVHTILPISIESIFMLLFHKSKFFTEFHNMRRTTDLKQGEWEDMGDGTKRRVLSLTVAITQTVGPKSSNVTETQIMRSCSKPGQLYSIDATSVNAGELRAN